jgi:hypothetical protein
MSFHSGSLGSVGIPRRKPSGFGMTVKGKAATSTPSPALLEAVPVRTDLP